MKIIITLPEGIITPEHTQEALKNCLEEDIVFQWLMAHGRRQDAYEYRDYYLPHFEEEARQAGMSIEFVEDEKEA